MPKPKRNRGVMELTKENKEYIDGLDYEQLLSQWRFAPVGNPWFQGETGKYWKKRMGEKRSEDPNGTVQASKNIGW